jgi:hypothetical protein
MRVNYFLCENPVHFQPDKQIALENGKNSNPMTVLEKIIQDGDRLDCVVCAVLVARLRFIEL